MFNINCYSYFTGYVRSIKENDKGTLLTLGISVMTNKKGEDGKRVSNWFNVKCFGSHIEYAKKYIHEGSPISVIATPEENVYEKDGKKTHSIQFTLEHFGHPPQDRNNTSPKAASTPLSGKPAAGGEEGLSMPIDDPEETGFSQLADEDDNLPF